MPGLAACGKYATPLAAITNLHMQKTTSTVSLQLGEEKGGEEPKGIPQWEAKALPQARMALVKRYEPSRSKSYSNRYRLGMQGQLCSLAAAQQMQCRCYLSVARKDLRNCKDAALFAAYLSGDLGPVKVPDGRA